MKSLERSPDLQVPPLCLTQEGCLLPGKGTPETNFMEKHFGFLKWGIGWPCLVKGEGRKEVRFTFCAVRTESRVGDHPINLAEAISHWEDWIAFPAQRCRDRWPLPQPSDPQFTAGERMCQHLLSGLTLSFVQNSNSLCSGCCRSFCSCWCCWFFFNSWGRVSYWNSNFLFLR